MLLFLFYEHHGECGTNEEYTRKHKHPNGVRSKAIFQYQPTKQSINYLRNSDKEVEDAHIDTHLILWQIRGQHSIRHSEDRSPSYTNTHHWQNK